MLNSEALLKSITRLFLLLKERKIEYLLVGGTAVLQYIERRNTHNIDLIMALASFRKLPELKITRKNIDFAHVKFDNLRIDILLTRNKLFKKVQNEYATTQYFLEQEIPCATVEGLLLLKLYALPSLYRQSNFPRIGVYENDIALLIYNYNPKLNPLLKTLTHYLSRTDITAVREIVHGIEQKIARFNKGLGSKQ